MKITINGKVTIDAINSILEEQKDKTRLIDEYCKKQKIETLYYKDAELEYEYTRVPNQKPTSKKEVETRWTKKKQD